MAREVYDHVQFYWDPRVGRYRLRALAEKAKDPTPAQLETRIAFGRAARGVKGRAEVNRRIREALRGRRSALTKEPPRPKWKDNLVTFLRTRELAKGERRISEEAAEDQVDLVLAVLLGGL